MVCQSVDRLVYRSVGWSVNWSLGHSVARSVNQPVSRSAGFSVVGLSLSRFHLSYFWHFSTSSVRPITFILCMMLFHTSTSLKVSEYSRAFVNPVRTLISRPPRPSLHLSSIRASVHLIRASASSSISISRVRESVCCIRLSVNLRACLVPNN